jgi:hypothetical protein
MDDFETIGSGNKDSQKPIPFDNSQGSISHSPLNLGGAGPSSEEAESAPEPTSHLEKPAGEIVSWPDRITGVKNFFTKLHPGAIEFMDEQITAWLRDNPGVQIKRTNTISGDIVGKKTEPSIIVTIWY